MTTPCNRYVTKVAYPRYNIHYYYINVVITPYTEDGEFFDGKNGIKCPT